MSVSSVGEVEITKAVLGWFQQLLVKTKELNESPVPEEIYVEMRTKPSCRLPPGDVSAKWRITRQEIEALPVEFPRPRHVSRGFGYYRIAWGEFSISEDNRYVTVGFKFGPGSGRGDVYQIIRDASNNAVVQRLKPAWTLEPLG